MMRKRNVTRFAGFWVILLLLALGVSHGQTISEIGDAGDVPSSAQDASGIPITRITGEILPADYYDKFNRDVDMYKITIDDPAAFSATTFDNATNFNTYLFLFDSDGKAVYMHDDVPKPGYITPYLQSTLPAGHALGPTTAGDYYLAVTGYICLPYDEDGNLVFETGLGRTVVHGPSASIKPVVHWQSPVYATFHSGDYQIDLTGVGLPNSPPVADAGSDVTVEQTSYAGAEVTLDGSGSSDPDGDPLTYSWTWPGGSASGVNPTVTLPLGTTAVTLTVDDGMFTDSDTVVITVVDTTPPELTIPEDVTVEQESHEGTVVPLEATATDICDPNPVITSDELDIYQLGVTVVTFTATDASGNSTSRSMTVTVVDTTPPTISDISANPDELWPPNHKMVPLIVLIEAEDICTETDQLAVSVTVTSNEPDDDKGDGAFTGDVDGQDGFTAPVPVTCVYDNEAGCFVCSFALRAECDGRDVGRTYTITATVTDLSGSTVSDSCTVVVPHDQGKGKK